MEGRKAYTPAELSLELKKKSEESASQEETEPELEDELEEEVQPKPIKKRKIIKIKRKLRPAPAPVEPEPQEEEIEEQEEEPEEPEEPKEIEQPQPTDNFDSVMIVLNQLWLNFTIGYWTLTLVGMIGFLLIIETFLYKLVAILVLFLFMVIAYWRTYKKISPGYVLR